MIRISPSGITNASNIFRIFKREVLFMEKIKISICMGSSCYLRGNRELAAAIEDFILENHYENYFEMMGNLCEDECKEGPNVRINNILYSKANKEKIIQKITQLAREL